MFRDSNSVDRLGAELQKKSRQIDMLDSQLNKVKQELDAAKCQITELKKVRYIPAMHFLCHIFQLGINAIYRNHASTYSLFLPRSPIRTISPKLRVAPNLKQQPNAYHAMSNRETRKSPPSRVR